MEEKLTNYEMTFVVGPDVQEMEVAKLTTRIQSWIASHGGSVISTDAWGKHRLAYPIGKAEFAWYTTLMFSLPSGHIAELEGEMRHTLDIIRFLILSLDKEGIKLDNYKKVDPFKEAAPRTSAPTSRPTYDAPKPKKAEPVADTRDEATRLKELDEKLEELLKEE